LIVLETERLTLRHLCANDADFIQELLNEPAFLQNIGDRGVRSTADAQKYLREGPQASYEKNGFGLYLVELKEAAIPIGICGLLKRDSLENVDIGFAFLQRHWSKGYAQESAAAILEYGHKVKGLNRIVAITALENQGSIRVLEKIGLQFERIVRLSDYKEDSKLFSIDF
jgi:ribosomal-protein-alanine N-acetyltransferase